MKPFHSGRMYTHCNMLDVGFYVYDTMPHTDGISLLVQWVNVRGKYVIDVRETIFVKEAQIKNYKEIDVTLK